MKVHVFIEVKGTFDSKQLYELIEQYGMNLTDLGNDTVLVYGDCHLLQATQVVYHCSLFGNTKSDITH